MTSNNRLVVGGIIGQNDADAGLTIDNCKFTGKLETFFDEEHKSKASSYMGYALAKGGNDPGKEVTTINNFTVGDGSSIVGYQNVTTHSYPFEGLNKYDSSKTYTELQIMTKNYWVDISTNVLLMKLQQAEVANSIILMVQKTRKDLD